MVLENLTKWENIPLTINARQVSKILNISLPKVYELFHREDFPAIKISSNRFIVGKDQLKKWLNTKSASFCDKSK